MSDDGHEFIIELEAQVHCCYERGLNPLNPPLGCATGHDHIQNYSIVCGSEIHI